MRYSELILYCLVIGLDFPNIYLIKAELNCNTVSVRSESKHVSLVPEVNFPNYFPPLQLPPNSDSFKQFLRESKSTGMLSKERF